MTDAKTELAELLGPVVGRLVTWMERNPIPRSDVPDVVAVDAMARLAGEAVEVELLYMFDNNTRHLGTVEIGRGSETSTNFSIAEVARQSLLRNAKTVVLIHNHPVGSGAVYAASDADRDASKKVNLALEAIGINVIGHYVIDESGFIDVMRGQRTRWRAMLTSDVERNISGPCCPECGCPISPIERGM